MFYWSLVVAAYWDLEQLYEGNGGNGSSSCKCNLVVAS
jgi:hypothetical protein